MATAQVERPTEEATLKSNDNGKHSENMASVMKGGAVDIIKGLVDQKHNDQEAKQEVIKKPDLGPIQDVSGTHAHVSKHASATSEKKKKEKKEDKKKGSTIGSGHSHISVQKPVKLGHKMKEKKKKKQNKDSDDSSSSSSSESDDVAHDKKKKMDKEKKKHK
ncbi:uncharacterized protein LOC131245123 [Magnolia sinica]|uniref:uncharacterized protein LOC131245123 n=1 Tax=Magnolia sinica TaxID=86752 RepID=UPI002659C778|nr:uncharacterized protein LOC131245123 [Magnolia sinica]